MLLLFFVLVVFMLAPFDFTFNVSEIKAYLKDLLIDPWETSRAIQHEWIQMVEFALFGVFSGVLARSKNFPLGLSPMRGIIASLSLPIILELGQLFVSSHAPSLRDMLMGFWGVGVGLVCSLYKPTIIRPITGVLFMTAGMIAAGLSPYQFVSWDLRSDFYWIPLFEYYTRTTMEALYDAGIGIVNFALLAALIQAAFHWSRLAIIVAVVCLAGGIELAQLLVPERVAGTTDMIIAALGGWTGVTVWTVVQLETLLKPHPTSHMRKKAFIL
jgi:VanZ family protein